MSLFGMLWQQKLLLGAFILAATGASQPDSSCSKTCGNVSIPYPFGISKGCYLDPSFQITCNYSFEPPKPFLGSDTSSIDVLDISLLDGEMRVFSFVARDCYNESGLSVEDLETSFAVALSKFPISCTKNKFTVVGCDTYAFIEGSGVKNYTTGCTAFCDRIESVVNNSCSGLGCCQSSIPEGIWDFDINVNSYKNHSAVRSFNPCGFAFLVEAEAYSFSSIDLQQLESTESVPLVIDWAVGNETCEDAQKNMTSYACKAEDSYCYNSTNGPGYCCNCSDGFQGNPYLPHGCTGN